LTEIEKEEATQGVSVPVHHGVLRLVKADITTLDVEAFVFYARPDLALGSGFGNAIARRAGPAVKKALDAIGSVAPTDAVITPGGNLKARHIVHAAGPVFREERLQEKLRTTIANALKRAEEHGIAQIAFPPMGAGFYGVPLPVCVDVMLSTIGSCLSNSTGIREVVICANDTREFAAFEPRVSALRRSVA
jgi:O-acetyl-ADP-ribose deacetylase (regulator of RNase III)